MEPTSEQELKQLLDEGRITEEEYRELLEAIRQKETMQKPVEEQKVSKFRSGFGNAATTLMVGGIVLPAGAVLVNALWIFLSPPNTQRFLFLPILGLFLLCESLALIFGIIGWKTTEGKVAVIGVPCMGFVVLMVIIVMPVFLHVFTVKYTGEPTNQSNFQSCKAYPLDSREGVLTRKGIEFDRYISADGNGSLRVDSTNVGKTVTRLFETGPMEIENRMLIYSAKLRSGALSGKAYLEMWCEIPGKGEFFSHGLEQAVSGGTEWTTVSTPFRLEAGQMPDNVKLNLVIEGTGTVWIDDIKLLSSPLD